ncbi:MAG: TldD/PmbA family protein [Bacteroidales bacterium]|nr:TldD/PmbA family protein [Bacteroidales bacterium]
MTDKLAPGIITPEEILLTEQALSFALSHGADSARLTLNKSLLDLVAMRDGELDRVSHSLDRSLQLSLFADGRFGTFSINRLESKALEEFILDALGTLKLLAPDPLRSLPSPERTAKDAVTGLELDLYDPAYAEMDPSKRKALAEKSTVWARKASLEDGFTVISEEEEYSDSVFDTLLIDSVGTRCRHTETSFEIACDLTVQDPSGARYNAVWWDARPFLRDLDIDGVAEKAVRKAAEAIGPLPCGGGRMSVVVDTECASKLVTPLLNALGGFALQQKNSFMDSTLGLKVLGDNVTILDRPRSAGETGSRLFDSEGVATEEVPVIDGGVVKRYFLTTWTAAKLSMEPTCDDCIRPCIAPTGGCRDLEEILADVGEGILITGFNGGNSNTSTGEYSFGIEGFLFKNGRRVHPVREMVMTGDFRTLWNNLTHACSDARECQAKQIPTLAFKNVEISG